MALFDELGQPVAPGAVGEVHLAGSQLTRGYWRQPKLDEDKFLTIDGTRWYRTGDLGRWSESDGFHYLGRIDHQIKIRGYRVELLEIEGALRTATGRDLVAVIPWPQAVDGVADGVVGFIVGEPLDPGIIRKRLETCLPDYMLPHSLLFLEALPLNSNGKIDARALAESPALHALQSRGRHEPTDPA